MQYQHTSIWIISCPPPLPSVTCFPQQTKKQKCRAAANGDVYNDGILGQDDDYAVLSNGGGHYSGGTDGGGGGGDGGYGDLKQVKKSLWDTMFKGLL